MLNSIAKIEGIFKKMYFKDFNDHNTRFRSEISEFY